MKITRLDNFGEGFKSTPRPAHKEPAKRVSAKDTTDINSKSVLEEGLKENRIVYLSEFTNKMAVKNAVGKLRLYGWRIKTHKQGRKAVGYELIRAQ